MLQHLLSHAVQNVWCSPLQDKQSILKPARLTPTNGAMRRFNLLCTTVDLPDRDHTYHVFQLANISPKLLGIDKAINNWVRLVDIVNESSLIANVYNVSGVVYPMGSTYLRRVGRTNFLIAVKEDIKLSGYRDTDIYFRFYTNAYYQSVRYTGDVNPIRAVSGVSSGVDSVLAFQTVYHNYRNKPGRVFAYHNGYMVNDFSPGRVQYNDTMEFIYDPSVHTVLDFKVSDLRSFFSEKDLLDKYLLHKSLDEWDSNIINYEDDVEVAVLRYGPNGISFKGVYHNRNLATSLRMITHRDYSIPCDSIEAFKQQHTHVFEHLEDMVIRLYIRHSGYDRPLIMEANRIHELYKLPDSDILDAMLGHDATVPEWHCNHLEQSSYIQLMKWRNEAIDPTIIQMAYGYNFMSRLLGDTPTHTRMEGASKVVDVPTALLGDCTAYEYDDDGKLLGYYYVSGNDHHMCNHAETDLVELIAGRGDYTMDVDYDSPVTVLDPEYNYRAYICSKSLDQPLFDWEDVSGTTLYRVIDGQLEWLVDQDIYYTAVMSDKVFLADRYILEPVNGVLRFTISVEEVHGNLLRWYAMSIPPRRLDVWLNGHVLIENIDYIVVWPQVVITNKAYLHPNNFNVIDIRGVNFCAPTMELETQREVGFVRHGYLSNNQVYDIHDDKVLSFVVGGSLVKREDVRLAERGGELVFAPDYNGQPYSIRETIVPLRGKSYLDTYTLRDKAMVTDTHVSNYMTPRIPPIPDNLPNVIHDRYYVYSPFASAVVYALENDTLLFPDITTNNYGTMDIREALSSLEYLLEYEPLNHFTYDEDLMVVLPHYHNNPVTLDTYKHNFLKRALDVYLDGRIPLSGYFSVVYPTY